MTTRKPAGTPPNKKTSSFSTVKHCRAGSTHISTSDNHRIKKFCRTLFFSLETWRAACEACGVDMDAVAQTDFDTDRVLPWAHLSAGIRTRFFQRERRLAAQERTTPDCTFDTCSACGICMDYGVPATLHRLQD